MIIALISGIHGHRKKPDSALKAVEHAAVLSCLGNICSSSITRGLSEGFSDPIHVVFVNNDGDLFRITQTAKNFTNITLHGGITELLQNGKRITHYDTAVRMLAPSDTYVLICFGHTLTYEVSHHKKTLLSYPGEAMGELAEGGSCVLYSPETNTSTKTMNSEAS
ncbi:MAG: metallophosphoesterase family protein [Calditrichia bacterium]